MSVEQIGKININVNIFDRRFFGACGIRCDCQSYYFTVSLSFTFIGLK